MCFLLFAVWPLTLAGSATVCVCLYVSVFAVFVASSAGAGSLFAASVADIAPANDNGRGLARRSQCPLAAKPLQLLGRAGY